MLVPALTLVKVSSIGGVVVASNSGGVLVDGVEVAGVEVAGTEGVVVDGVEGSGVGVTAAAGPGVVAGVASGVASAVTVATGVGSVLTSMKDGPGVAGPGGGPGSGRSGVGTAGPRRGAASGPPPHAAARMPMASRINTQRHAFTHSTSSSLDAGTRQNASDRVDYSNYAIAGCHVFKRY